MKTLAFPINQESAYIIRNKHLIQRLSIVRFVCFRGSGFVGKKISDIDGGYDIDVEITDNFSLAVQDTKAVLVLPYRYNTVTDNVVAYYLEKALSQGKELIFLDKCAVFTRLKMTYPDKTISCLSISQNDHSILSPSSLDDQPRVPIITIAGLINRCSQESLQLNLLSKLCDQGIRVLYVSSNGVGALVEGYAYPSFMQDQELSEENKICFFRSWLLDLTKRHKPDLILLGVPGDTINIFNRNDTTYGLSLYEIGHAINSDYFLLCLPYLSTSVAFFDIIKSHFQHRYNVTIDCFIQSNIGINDLTHQHKHRAIEYDQLDPDIIQKHISSLSEVNIINPCSENDIISLSFNIINSFKSNSEHNMTI